MFGSQTFADLTGKPILIATFGEYAAVAAGCRPPQLFMGSVRINSRPSGDSFWRNLRPSARSITPRNLRHNLNLNLTSLWQAL